MKIEIANDTKNPLLSRRDVEVVLEGFEKTPAKKDVMDAVSAKLGVPAKTVMIRKIEQDFGRTRATASVKVYDDEAKLKKYETEHLVKRMEKAAPKEKEAAEETKGENDGERGKEEEKENTEESA